MNWKMCFVAAAALLAAGCGDGLVPVRGKVVYPNGEPMSGGGRLVLMPVGGGPSAVAAVLTDGTFRAYTLKPEPPDGVRPGSYRVGVSGNQETPGASSPHVDEALADPTTSGITVEVQPGDNDLTVVVRKPNRKPKSSEQ